MGIEAKNITEVLESRFLDYAMSVVTDRAIPNIYDGLKPVQRRIIWTLRELKATNEKPTKKSAKIVGECMGSYHPHGDSSIYGALVRMGQEWILNNPLVHPQGNFGSIDDSYSFADARYTEAKMAKIGEELIHNIHKGLVPFVKTYSNENDEPTVLPARYPNLLVNGSKGIAVGMATEIPTHNLNEVLEAFKAYITDKKISLEGLMSHLPGPDFPTGGIVRGKSGLKEMYSTGRGKFQIFSKVEIGERKGKEVIIIKELPYGIEKADLVNSINEVSKPANKNEKPSVEGIEKCQDESGKETRKNFEIIVYIKKGYSPEVVLNKLYKTTNLMVNYNSNFVVLDGKMPKTVGLLEFFDKFYNFRVDCLTKAFNYDKKQAEDRLHIIEGYEKILDNIDKTIQLIKSSKTNEEAHKKLTDHFSLSKSQCDAVLSLQLRRITSLEVDKVKQEIKDLKLKVKEIDKILKSPDLLDAEIVKELVEISNRYKAPRNTVIENIEVISIDESELVEDKDCILTISHKSYVNRIDASEYKLQNRGGKGHAGISLSDEDYTENIIWISSKDYLLCFTDKGRVHWLKAYNIPLSVKGSKGKPIINFLENLDDDEIVQKIIGVSDLTTDKYLTFFTTRGLVKKTHLSEYSKPRRGGIQAISIAEDDSICSILLTNKGDEVLIGTQEGVGIRFNLDSVRVVGRVSKGVLGIRLKTNDKVINSELLEKGTYILCVTDKGFGKKTLEDQYRIQSRGGQGSKIIKLTDSDKLCTFKSIKGQEVVLLSESGKSIVLSSGKISDSGRVTRGVKLINLSKDDKVADIIIREEEEII